MVLFLLIVGIICSMSGVLVFTKFEKVGVVITGIGICFLIASIPFAVLEANKSITYEIAEVSCYESYHEEQVVRVMVKSPLYKGYYFYMYMTPNQFSEYKVEGKNQLMMTDKELDSIPRTNRY